MNSVMIRILPFALFLFGIYLESCSNEQASDKNTETPKGFENKDTDEIEKTDSDTLFKYKMSFQDIIYHASIVEELDEKKIVLITEGLENGNDTFITTTNGHRFEPMLEDMDADGFPEFILVATIDKLNFEVHGFSPNNGKSLSSIAFRNELPVYDSTKATLEKIDLALIETKLSKRAHFKGKDGNEFIIQTDYSLQPGEALKQLVKVKEYKY